MWEVFKIGKMIFCEKSYTGHLVTKIWITGNYPKHALSWHSWWMISYIEHVGCNGGGNSPSYPEFWCLISYLWWNLNVQYLTKYDNPFVNNALHCNEMTLLKIQVVADWDTSNIFYMIYINIFICKHVSSVCFNQHDSQFFKPNFIKVSLKVCVKWLSRNWKVFRVAVRSRQLSCRNPIEISRCLTSTQPCWCKLDECTQFNKRSLQFLRKYEYFSRKYNVSHNRYFRRCNAVALHHGMPSF